MIGLRVSAAQQELRRKAAGTATKLAHRNKLRRVIISRYRLSYSAGPWDLLSHEGDTYIDSAAVAKITHAFL
jgi:hypothetical protein